MLEAPGLCSWEQEPKWTQGLRPCLILPSFQDENHRDLLLSSLVWIAACISSIQRLSTDLVYKVLLGALLKRSVPEKRGRIKNLWPPSHAVGASWLLLGLPVGRGEPLSHGHSTPLCPLAAGDTAHLHLKEADSVALGRSTECRPHSLSGRPRGGRPWPLAPSQDPQSRAGLGAGSGRPRGCGDRVRAQCNWRSC